MNVDFIPADFVKSSVQLFVRIDIAFRIALFDEIERRLGNVNIAALYHRPHVPIEERQQQRANMASVNIGIGHADDFVIAELGFVKIRIHARTERGYHAFDFRIAENFVQTGFFNVQNLSAQRKDGLKMPVASFLGGTACGVALNDEQFAF